MRAHSFTRIRRLSRAQTKTGSTGLLVDISPMLLQGRAGRAGSARSQRSVKSARSGKSSYSNLVEERIQLSKEQMHRIETAFSKYDSERKGSVNRDQMGKIMEELGHRPRSDQELEGLLRWAGKHTSTGKTSFDEYVECSADDCVCSFF